jgi:hypothetical protein
MHQEFDPRDLEPSLPKREERPVRSKLAPILIAAVALTGFGGVVWYAYDQGIRQSGPPAITPLIKADTSPTKIRPEQPGGMEVPHQDKLVLNTLADGNKAGAPQVERLLPPPESPLPRPAPTAQPPVMTPQAPATAANGAGLPPRIGPTPPAPAPGAVTAPVTPPPAATAAAPPAPAAAPRDAVQSSGSSGAASTQTAAAPGATQPAPKPAAEKPKAVPAAAPSATGGGGFKVQLVSVKAQDQTNQEWARLQRTYPQLASLKMSVTRVDLGEKGIWYRIYAGPLSDAGAAGDLCGAIKAKDQSQGCVVVKP